MKKIHNNCHLQNAWNKYGAKNFIFEVIEEVPLEKQFSVEQKYLDKLQPYLGNIGYNISKVADIQSTYKTGLCDKCTNTYKPKLYGVNCTNYCLNECKRYMNYSWEFSDLYDLEEDDEDLDADDFDCVNGEYWYKNFSEYSVDDHLAYEWDERMSK